jgi:hypothetical protein
MSATMRPAGAITSVCDTLTLRYTRCSWSEMRRDGEYCVVVVVTQAIVPPTV